MDAGVVQRKNKRNYTGTSIILMISAEYFIHWLNNNFSKHILEKLWKFTVKEKCIIFLFLFHFAIKTTELIGKNPLRNVAKIIKKKNIKRLYRGKKRTFFWGLNYFIFLQVQTTTTAFQQVASVKDTIWSTNSNPKIEHVGAFHGLTVSVQFKVKYDTHTVCLKEVRHTFAILDVAAGIVMKHHLQSSFFRREPLLSEIWMPSL